MAAFFPPFAPLQPHTTTLALFFGRVQVERSGCWLWTGAVNNKGYGIFESTSAHRFTYAWFVEPIPAGFEVDHLCRTRRCVNPAHGEAVTGIENRRRANRFDTTGRCQRGHRLTECGIGSNGEPGLDRICIACRRLRQARYLRAHDLELPEFALIALAQENLRLATQAARRQRVAS